MKNTYKKDLKKAYICCLIGGFFGLHFFYLRNYLRGSMLAICFLILTWNAWAIIITSSIVLKNQNFIILLILFSYIALLFLWLSDLFFIRNNLKK